MNFGNVYNKVQNDLDNRYVKKESLIMPKVDEKAPQKLINVVTDEVNEITSSASNSGSSSSSDENTTETKSANLENDFVSSQEFNDDSEESI